jgi:nitrite reductase/ring-hydroxylating ferredoxin subunit
MFGLAGIHGVFSTIQFHALGNENPLVSLWTAYQRDYRIHAGGGWNLAQFPFEPFGVVALLILGVLAVTSHDFWLRNLGAAFWKTLHLGGYAAYGLLVVHVGLGALQDERSPVYVVLLGLGFCTVTGVHLAAAWKEARMDRLEVAARNDGFVDAGSTSAIPEGRARVVVISGQRIAVWRHHDRFHATSNVCRHQGGPVGEGCIVDGCITCPWHGWNYRPEDGCSPPPFNERLATYAVRVFDGHVWVATSPPPHGEFVAHPKEGLPVS